MEQNSVILITGASRGIGASLARHFLDRGMRVEGCSRSASDLADPNYRHHQVDVSNETAVSSMVQDIERRQGRLDAVVNNAGVLHQGYVLLTGKEAAQNALAVNFIGTFLVCREAAKAMQRRKSGRIINMGSIATKTRFEGSATYVASKAAVVEFTRVFAKELAPFGVTCNVISPGLVDTEMFRSLPKEAATRCLDRVAARRMTPLDVLASTIEWVLGDSSRLITGQEICLGTID